MKRNRHGLVAVNLILCMLLLVSTFLPQLTFANSNSDASISLLENSDVASKNVKAKVDKKLNDQFSKDETVTFLLKLKDQVDTKNVATETAKKAKAQKQTAAKTELMKRSAVVSSLRAKASETQYSIKTYLDQEKKKGNVEEFQSFYIVNGMAVTGTKEVMEKLATFPEVEKILPNETVQLSSNESSETSIQPTADTQADTTSIEWNIAKIDAPQAWNMGIDGTGTVVASIDTGVQWNHPALKEKYRGYNPANPDQPDNTFNWFDAVSGQAAPSDNVGRGTHVIGTMVGSEPNGTNQIGVAPGAKWIAVKAFTPTSGTQVDLLEAGEWVLAPKDAEGNPHPEKAPDVVVNSWGLPPGTDEWFRPMVQNWRAAEIFPAFAAGNYGPKAGSISNPANYPESFAIGATDSNNRVVSFSSRGPSTYGEVKPDISAPGANIRSSVPGSSYEVNGNGTYMSAPQVAGVVALMKQANASLTVDEMEQILLDTAIPLTDSLYPTSPNNGYGHGLVNAYNAVSSIISGLGQVQGQVVSEDQDIENPTYLHTAPTETYSNVVLPLTVQVQDNFRIDSVELQYRASETAEWQTVAATRTAGDYKSGTYQAVIPDDAVQVPTLTYHWRITDYGQNVVTSDDYVVPVKPGISTGYYQDFESQPNGWISYGTQNTWEWGVPTFANGPGIAASGEKVYGTNLDGNYDNNANMSLMMPPIVLPEGNAYLQFKDWYAILNYDYGQVLVSTDKQNWQQLYSITRSSEKWIERRIDLSAYAGQRIYIAFNVTTDSTGTKAGWYIDDVALSNTPLTTANVELEDVQQDKLLARQLENELQTNKKAVNPEAIKPTEIQNVMAPTATITQAAVQPMSLPLGATVSVLESGRSVTTNPVDGSYGMIHPAGEFTLRAETSYGYYSTDQRVNIPADGTVEANFTLKPIPKGTINGTVINKQTGQPLANATLSLIEDALIQPVQTDENGRFSITAYEGTYTLHVFNPLYYGQDITITIPANGNIEQNIPLQPFVGYPNEIGYDDGTEEDALIWHTVGNDYGWGWGVKMSLPEGKNSALITAGLFRLGDNSYPAFKVAIYDASGPNGAPGRKLAGPLSATAQRIGEWTVVDLKGEGVIVNDDFYMVYIQPKSSPYTPALASDSSSPYAGHSWQLYNGVWSKSPEKYGNVMIRARVDFEAMTPVITTPKDEAYTNQPTFTVEGKASPTALVHLFNNGEEIAAAPTREDGTFSVNVPLQNGKNVLTATSSTDRGSTDPSEPVKIILDQAKPELTITKPTEGFKMNQKAVTIEGKATDPYLAEVTANGQKANVAEDGSYSIDVLLNNGENKFTVTAKDRAGNETSKEVTVYAKFNPPAIKNLKPAQNVVIKTGDKLTVELDSEPGISGFFLIRLPSAYATATATSAEIVLIEQGEGHYVGTWTAPKEKFNGAEIEVVMRDDYGNESRQIATGKVYVNVKPK
ncbi:S8 family serine peptidase [Bacillus sp. FJAT-49705]|uniref:S8 family serine peptidase n=1 Tax=Cytobacillus citreus TaxID=2833586 RepID=A0ABS5NX41_9BACI|nr:S8 family peptidase [Cytobacillus citreus]MBS4191984.1 S8 family serine peptidase [Cytobacillus citreus]